MESVFYGFENESFMKTKEEILKEATKRTLNINEGSPLHDAVMKAMEEYAQQQVKNCSIPAVIRSYSDKGIFIEVLADGYKLEGVGICWRGYVYWNENGEWKEEDCGCFTEWIDAFESSIKFIHDWVLHKTERKTN